MPAPALLAFLGPVLVQVGRWFVISQAGRLLGKVMLWAGIAFATKEAVIDPIIDRAISAWGTIPGQIAQWVGAFGFDVWVSVILSAHLASAVSRVFLAKKE